MDRSPELQNASIALIGRLDRVPKRRLTAALHGANTKVTRRMSGRSDLVVVAHGGLGLLPSGELAEILVQADKRQVPVISEHGLLRRLGMMPATQAEPRPYTLRELAAQSGLSPENARLLALFDIIEDHDGFYSFRDLKAARDFARRIGHHQDLSAALETALAARRRHAFRRHLAEVPLRSPDDSTQAALDLGEAVESFDETWTMALEAQASEDHDTAENLFRRCAAMRPRDALCLFQLADVIAELDRSAEALDLLRRAVALKPDFAEAWFNLSLLESGDAVQSCLERAMSADPACIEAVHDLAQIHMKDDAYDRALPLWERYLALAPASTSPRADRTTVERAKRALMLCRMARLQTRADSAPNR